MEIRPFDPNPEEYEAVLELRNLVDPDEPSTVAIWQHWDALRGADSLFERWVVADEYGRFQAYAQFDETHPNSKKFEFNLNGLPTIWQNGVADTFYQTILARIQMHYPHTLTIDLRESESEKLKLLQANGFQLVMRSPISQLDVSQFEAAEFQSLLENVAHSGIEIVQPPDGWQDDPYWQHLIHEMDWQLMKDVPHHEKRVQTPFVQFVQEEFMHPNFLAEGYFIAFDDGTPVGMTNFVKRGGKTERLATSITGVLPSHRRKGIGTALKVTSIQVAQTLGAKIILTNNEENNPMYDINIHLGFKPKPAWVNWEKKLGLINP